MCCVNGCTTGAADVLGSNAWGFSAGICQTHWAEFDSGVKNKPGPPPVPFPHDPAFLDDYIRLAALMLDTTTVEAAMTSLSTEIATAKTNAQPGDDRFTGKAHANYVRLSRVLECYEGYCWFPTTHVVYAGAVPGDEFLANLSSGLMPKDPGAGYLHGDFSHRLQWHTVMRTVTNGFTIARRVGWDHSPLELFASLGSTLASARGLWGYIFDRQNGKAYQDPSTLENHIRQNGAVLLQTNLQRRFDKRKAIEDLIYPYLQQKNLDLKIAAADVAAVLYRWRKAGGKPIFGGTEVEKVAKHFWDSGMADKIKNYEVMGSKAVLKDKTDPVPTPVGIQGRITYSRNGFDRHNFQLKGGEGASKRS